MVLASIAKVWARMVLEQRAALPELESLLHIYVAINMLPG